MPLDGQWTALAAIGLLALVLLLERLALRFRTNAWFLISLPLGRELVPLPSMPTGSGRTRSLRWEIDEDTGIVRYWADHESEASARGLHGAVLLVPDVHGRVHLDARWAPLWTPFLAVFWFIGLGAARGEASLTGPLGALMVGALLYANWTLAVPAVAELRFGLIRALEGEVERPRQD